MTPADEARTAAWLAEMWAPVKEHHQTDGERADAYLRQQGADKSVEKPDDHPKKVA